ncbi:hypothetical protein [Hymenobacter sp. PAMC 26628]|uniref:hypothetical protein n=1 Tax=Hymenobacter sp. PAMC 26628 TaxID=1484118 RepID=UPI000A623FBC|nr:hypothetical protein [Hymenobacter sp. PAMC 26628]
MKSLFALLAIILPYVATAQTVKKITSKKAATTLKVSVPREPNLKGLGPFIIGKSITAILNPLKAEWNTDIRVAISAIEVELQTSTTESIIELKPALDNYIFNAPQCSDSRVFVLPKYLVQIGRDGTVKSTINLYITFYKGVLARIWSGDTETIQNSFQDYYHFIDGIEAQAKSAEIITCYDSQIKKYISRPLTTTKTTTWQNGDVVAVSYSIYSYAKDATNCAPSRDSFLVIKSRRLDAELLSCEAASKIKP